MTFSQNKESSHFFFFFFFLESIHAFGVTTIDIEILKKPDFYWTSQQNVGYVETYIRVKTLFKKLIFVKNSQLPFTSSGYMFRRKSY